MRFIFLLFLLGAAGAYYYTQVYNRTPEIVATELVEAEVEAPEPSKTKTRMYQWVDENGVLQMSGTPPRGDIEYEVIDVVVHNEMDKYESIPNLPSRSSSKPRTQYGSSSSSSSNQNNSACEAAKAQLLGVKREVYTDQPAHREKVRRYEQRVRSRC